MKLKIEMFMNIVLKTENYLILVDIQKIQNIIIVQIKKILVKMKDEFYGVKIIEFIGLKSKMYSLISADDQEVNKAKGINKKIRHKEYVDVLFNKAVFRHNMKRIQSKLHEIGTYGVFKIAISCFDDKIYVLDDGINTLAYFNKDIKGNKYPQNLMNIHKINNTGMKRIKIDEDDEYS